MRFGRFSSFSTFLLYEKLIHKILKVCNGNPIHFIPQSASYLSFSSTIPEISEILSFRNKFDHRFPPSFFVSKMYLLKRGWNPGFWWLLILSSFTSFLIISLSENIKNVSFNISCFRQCLSIFWIFWHFLVTQKLITSAHNMLYQHFFTLTYFK